MAQNLSHGMQSAWDRAFAKQDQAMNRTPATTPAVAVTVEDPATKARVEELEGRVTALETQGDGNG
jgi:hypothetical protein